MLSRSIDGDHVTLMGLPIGVESPRQEEVTAIRVYGDGADEVANDIHAKLSDAGDSGGPAGRLFGVDGQTARGFASVLFSDAYDESCLLAQSSIVGNYPDSMDRPGTSAVWLGIRQVRPQIMAMDAAKYGITVASPPVGWMDYPVSSEVLVNASMHLNREQVAGLIQRLQTWLDTGGFRQDTGSAGDDKGGA